MILNFTHLWVLAGIKLRTFFSLRWLVFHKLMLSYFWTSLLTGGMHRSRNRKQRGSGLRTEALLEEGSREDHEAEQVSEVWQEEEGGEGEVHRTLDRMIGMEPTPTAAPKPETEEQTNSIQLIPNYWIPIKHMGPHGKRAVQAVPAVQAGLLFVLILLLHFNFLWCQWHPRLAIIWE